MICNNERIRVRKNNMQEYVTCFNAISAHKNRVSHEKVEIKKINFYERTRNYLKAECLLYIRRKI